MNGPILRSKAELDRLAFFKARHENNLKHASPVLLDTVDPKMPPPVAYNAIQTVDNLTVGLGPRLMLLMMADTTMGLMANAPPAHKDVVEIEMGSWNRALYMLANHPTLYLEMAQEFEMLKAAGASVQHDFADNPAAIKPGTGENES